MRLISLDEVTSGCKLSKSVYSNTGDTILSSGIELTDLYINKLKQIGIPLLYIEDDRFEDVIVDDIVNYNTRKQLGKELIEATKNLQTKDEFDEFKIKTAVKQVVEDIVSSKSKLEIHSLLFSNSNYIISHCINVCVIAVNVGKRLGYNFSQLCDLGIGAVLHDIGREKDDNDKGNEHTIRGFKLLKKYRGISLFSAKVALEHHERFDGWGYPRKISGKDISEFSRIVSIVDFFDKLINTKVNGKSLMPFQAYNMIEKYAKRVFDEDIVKMFKDTIVLYPTGCLVKLNTGHNGVVVKQNEKLPDKPTLRIFSQKDPSKTADIDLINKSQLLINQVII